MIAFVWRRHAPPLFWGGAEVSQRALARALLLRGRRVQLVGSHELPFYPHSNQADVLRKTLGELGIPFHHDARQDRYSYQVDGLHCVSVPQAHVIAECQRLTTQRVEAIFTSHEGAVEICSVMRRHTRLIGWIHSASQRGLEVCTGRPDWILASSKFLFDCAARLKSPRSKLSLYYPPFDSPKERIGQDSCGPGSLVTMVNPIAEKGSDLFFALVSAQPDRQFAAQEGWWPVEIPRLSNLIYFERTPSLERLIARTRVLLVPSSVPEGFGRVVVEFGLRGVPSFAHRVGGLPEAVGDEPRCLPDLQVTTWTSALSTVDSAIEYAKASETALRYSQTFVRDYVQELHDLGALP